jgi:hypothetical protein
MMKEALTVWRMQVPALPSNAPAAMASLSPFAERHSVDRSGSTLPHAVAHVEKRREHDQGRPADAIAV